MKDYWLQDYLITKQSFENKEKENFVKKITNFYILMQYFGGADIQMNSIFDFFIP